MMKRDVMKEVDGLRELIKIKSQRKTKEGGIGRVG
jgi:hypothetical protein